MLNITGTEFKDFRQSVIDFKGENAMKSITGYISKLFHYDRTEFCTIKKSDYRLTNSQKRAKTASEYKPLERKHIAILGGLTDYARAGNIDSLHAFLFVQDSQEIDRGIYYIEGTFIKLLSDEIYDKLRKIYQHGNRGDELNIDELPSVLFIVAEHTVKMDKYKDLGYEYCLLEAGMMLQNLYLKGSDTLAIRPMGSYDKQACLEALDLSDDFTPMISVIIGAK